MTLTQNTNVMHVFHDFSVLRHRLCSNIVSVVLYDENPEQVLNWLHQRPLSNLHPIINGVCYWFNRHGRHPLSYALDGIAEPSDAEQQRQESVVRALLEAKANVCVQSPWATLRGTTKDQLTPMHEAVRPGLLRLLVEAKSDVNALSSLGWTPLMHHSYHGRWSSVDYLLECGADVHREAPDGEHAVGIMDNINQIGWTDIRARLLLRWRAQLQSCLWVACVFERDQLLLTKDVLSIIIGWIVPSSLTQ